MYEKNTDTEVKRRTGFERKVLMIVMIAVACNGDHDKMKTPVTSLTWLEEWFMYY